MSLAILEPCGHALVSPASVRRLADFDRDKLVLDSDDNNLQGNINELRKRNKEDIDIKDVSRTDEKEGGALKMLEIVIHSRCQEIQESEHPNEQEQLTHEEANIGHSGTACNEVGSPIQKNLKEANLRREVHGGSTGWNSSASARGETPSNVGFPEVCSCKLQGKD